MQSLERAEICITLDNCFIYLDTTTFPYFHVRSIITPQNFTIIHLVKKNDTSP